MELKINSLTNNMKVLIMGASGSGKTYVLAKLRERGINAPDADLIDSLHGWFDASGNKVSYPEDADKDFLDNHEFLWNKDYLRNYLDKKDGIYLFGMSGNVFDMLDLFDKVYFLQADPALLAERLRHESRANPMGRTDYQLENAIKWATEIEEKAKSLHIPMIDAKKSPNEIFVQIKNRL